MMPIARMTREAIAIPPMTASVILRNIDSAVIRATARNSPIKPAANFFVGNPLFRSPCDSNESYHLSSLHHLSVVVVPFDPEHQIELSSQIHL